jgi:L-asparaginase
MWIASLRKTPGLCLADSGYFRPVQMNSKILLLYTGGTIGMMQDEHSGALRPFDFDQLLAQIPEIGHYSCEIDTFSLNKPVDSSNIKPDHWVRLARRIYEGYAYYDGFVILHGSDTMAFSASALSFMLENLAKPVILTGSQLPIGITRSDARENLLTAIEIALARRSNSLAMIPEVALYFENNLLRGNRSHKISTEDFMAFRSLNYPELAEVGVHIKYNEAAIGLPSKDSLILHEKMDGAISILTMFPGLTPSYVEAVLGDANMKGLILRSFGSGNIPTDDWLLRDLKETIDRGVEVVNISQCSGGTVEQGKYETSKALKEMGVIPAGDMSFESGLTKMMYLLGHGFRGNDFRRLYETNLRGELTVG